jgi:hypothetical protein
VVLTFITTFADDSCKERDIIYRILFAGRESGEHAIQVIRDIHECGDAHAFQAKIF